jgi:K(+)-stimulated pyrophosphate-energized sodium pump
MNILIKLMSIVSLVIAPSLADIFNTKNNIHPDAANPQKNRSINLSAARTTTTPDNTFYLR